MTDKQNEKPWSEPSGVVVTLLGMTLVALAIHAMVSCKRYSDCVRESKSELIAPNCGKP